MSYAITFDSTGGLSLAHHGIKGMRWGIRRYQNEDGSLTAAGRKRYYGRADALQKDIDSFTSIKNGAYTKSGKQILSKADVSASVAALEAKKEHAKARGDKKRAADKAKMDRQNSTKSRYRQGKEYDAERTKLTDAEYEKIKKNAKEYQEAEREALRLAKKYGLDMDDGGGGDYSRWTEAQLRMAGERYWKISEDLESMDDKFQNDAWDRANKLLTAKYGSNALSDIKYYECVNGARSAAITLSVIGALALIKHTL